MLVCFLVPCHALQPQAPVDIFSIMRAEGLALGLDISLTSGGPWAVVGVETRYHASYILPWGCLIIGSCST